VISSGLLIVELGNNACFLRLDVTKPEECNNAVKVAEENFGPVTTLVNNAGINNWKLKM